MKSVSADPAANEIACSTFLNPVRFIVCSKLVLQSFRVPLKPHPLPPPPAPPAYLLQDLCMTIYAAATYLTF